METRKLTDIEIEEMNLDALDLYLKEVKEYEEKGYWTAFMGVQINSPPPEPNFLDYNYGIKRRKP